MTDSVLKYGAVVAALIIAELLYFAMASALGIVDKPNNRSSHITPTIRGGGVIFPLAAIAAALWFAESDESRFVSGLMLIAIVSFVDDVRSVPALLRLLIHVGAIVLMFLAVPMTTMPWWILIPAFIVSLGAVNAFNFMDGINGITGVYALVTLITFGYVQTFVTPFTQNELIWFVLCSVIVFLFFNFRKKAVCFAGDVGSATLAFIQIFLLLQLVQRTMNLTWVIFFLVFGIDSVITIVYRLRRKENIFKPHRTHLYQYLANELGWSHLSISILYGVAQALLNGFVIIAFINDSPALGIGVSLLFLVTYVVVRLRVTRLIKTTAPR